MTIDRLNSIDPIREPKKPVAAGRVDKGGKGDSISISADAAEKAELYRALELAKAAPDTRSERVAALKAKINDPSYIDDAVLTVTAERIVDQFLG